MQPSAEANQFWAIGADAALERLDVTRLGLSKAEAERRLAVHGPNRLPAGRRRSALARFALQFHNVLIYVLLASAVGHGADAALGRHRRHHRGRRYQRHHRIHSGGQGRRGHGGRPQHAVAACNGRFATGSASSSTRATSRLATSSMFNQATRFRRTSVSSGSRSLKVQESALTGESLPVDKDPAPVAADAALGDRASMAYSGTVVNYGQASGVVVATGAATEIGRINAMLSEVETLSTPLLQRMDEFARWLTVVILVVCAAVFAFGALVWGFDVGEMFMAAVGLAVSAIPEGLPAIITITLAIGVERMARRKAIIRQLPAVETLGAVTTICSDKTGTLTLNELIVRTIVTAGGIYDTTGSGYDPHGGFSRDGKDVVVRQDAHLTAALRPLALCNDAVLREKDGAWSVEGDPDRRRLARRRRERRRQSARAGARAAAHG